MADYEETIYHAQKSCEHCQTIPDEGMLHLKCFGNKKYQLCVENQKCDYRQKVIAQNKLDITIRALKKIVINDRERKYEQLTCAFIANTALLNIGEEPK